MFSKFIDYVFTYPHVPLFARKNFKNYHVQSDKVMIAILMLHWMVATFVTSIMYETYLYGFFGGALIVLPIIMLYRPLQGTQYYRYFMGIGMMLFSMIFIQQHLGRIEMHFHVFIGMAILTLYKDILPIVVAAITTILHHLIFNYLQLFEVSMFGMPVMVFNYGCGLDIVLLHGVFVLSELAVLGYIIRLQIEHSIALNSSENEILQLNKDLEYTSQHDTLTGLPNRIHLNNKLEIIKEQAQLSGKKFAVVFLDLDHFKNVNDTLGHDIGDALLKIVSEILKKNVNKHDLISRIGGDEFILVISNFEDENELIPLINHLISEFREEFYIKGYSLRLSASIGISIFPNDASSITDLMKFADIAMYKAKEDGRDGFSFFTQTLNTKVHQDVDLINDMQRAYQANEFKLYFQPKVSTQTEKVTGAEALIRWEHPQKGLISPFYFIPLAESTGFILALGEFVVKEGIASIKRLEEQGCSDFLISVNISTRQFQNSDLFALIDQELKRTQINPKHFGIEITESIMMQSIQNTLDTLNQIKALGVTVFMDDFGTGYSSLSYLKEFPIDILKIDKSFVDDIVDESENHGILINTILAMAHSLGIQTVAEGVEDRHQVEFLKRMKCDKIQGYYYSKPLPELEFREYFNAHRTS
jgi:diguanylate cyclase (GGDEF)-like protein